MLTRILRNIYIFLIYIKEKFRLMKFRNIKNISKLSIVFISKTRFHTNFVRVKKYILEQQFFCRHYF